MGCAIAMALAIDPDVSRPPLHLLFTTDEEEGMTGAAGVDPIALRLTGSRLINLDTEDDDEITIGSAGGGDVSVHFEGKRSVAADPMLRIDVDGLRGGHSGVEIASGRFNAISILGQLLVEWLSVASPRIVAVQGGDRRNAIPRSAHCELRVSPENIDAVTKLTEAFADRYRRSIGREEPKLQITTRAHDEHDANDANDGEPSRGDFGLDGSKTLVHLLAALPHGVAEMSAALPTLVQTSSNVAIVQTDGGHVHIHCSCRSSREGGVDEIVGRIESIAALAGATTSRGQSYPGWSPDPQSSLVQTVAGVYREMFDDPPKVNAIHAGLECGILRQRIGDHLQAVSIGPTIRGNHAPGERVSLSSVDKVYRWTAEVLRRL